MHTPHNYTTLSSSSSSSQSISVTELEEPLSEEDLQAIDAIEATFLKSSMKRLSSHLNDTPLFIIRRQLPSSFSLSPCQANVKMKYPAFKFGGRIFYSRTSTEVEMAAREILQTSKSKRGQTEPVVIGFDIEWRPTFKRGVLPGKVAVMQLCSGTDYCHVMHITHSGIPESLKCLLEDSTLLKTGVGISGDSGKVFRDYQVSVKAQVDLSVLANTKFDGEPKSWGLQSLTEILVCKELQKPNKIRLGNWEVDYLSKQQLEYAATDAFASWQLYQVLKGLPDAKPAANERSEEPKLV
ncbi:Werner syndrome-like exonuclease [Euphorbia peplus]|nr:Werner syndrome-like exonuclease [Euphorbia peplus]